MPGEWRLREVERVLRTSFPRNFSFFFSFRVAFEERVRLFRRLLNLCLFQKYREGGFHFTEVQEPVQAYFR